MPPPISEVAMPRLEQHGAADDMIVVNFDGLDVRDVLKTVGDLTGINFVPHESVSGPVTAMSPTPIRLGDLYRFLQTILDVSGFATIETNDAVKVVAKPEAIKGSVQVRIGADPSSIPRTDQIAAQIIPLTYADPAQVKQFAQQIVPGAQIATYPGTNLIVVTDTLSNIRHLAEMIARLDVEGARERVTLFPLTYASAQVLTEQIARILEKSRITGAPAPRGRTATMPDYQPKVLPDERTNSLIVIASDHDIAIIADLVEQLDIRRPTGTGNVHVTYLKNADANEVAASLEAAVPSMQLAGAVEATQQIQVTADASTNSLIIVASPQDFEVISQIIEKLDIVREQVLVEMLILEVTEEALTEIGVDWATLDDAVADSIRGFGLTNLGPRVSFLNGSLEGLAVGAWQGSGSDVKIGAILQALQKESGVNILSTPSILTSNHRKAKIIVGENRPFVTESRITENNNPLTPTVIQSFEYKDVGITLEITPHVSQGGLIRLEVDSEFTKLVEDVTTPSLQTPTTAKRTAQTVVTMGSGDTVVIGGLIRDDTISVKKKIPLVGDLPLIGALFTSKRDLTQKTNLLFFLTPHVMANQDQLRQMTERKKQEMTPTPHESD
jgi:general secretion pathway protein D